LNVAIRTLPDPAALALRDKINVPEAVIQNPVIGQELTVSEEVEKNSMTMHFKLWVGE
jgi:hypothetical protein